MSNAEREECEHCDGDGAITVTCDFCDGTGYADGEEGNSEPQPPTRRELEAAGQLRLT